MYSVTVDGEHYSFSFFDSNKYLRLFLDNLNYDCCWKDANKTSSVSHTKEDFMAVFGETGLYSVYLNTSVYTVFEQSLRTLKYICNNIFLENNTYLQTLSNLYLMCCNYNKTDKPISQSLLEIGDVGTMLIIFSPINFNISKYENQYYLTDKKTVNVPIEDKQMVLNIDGNNNIVSPELAIYTHTIYFYKIPYVVRNIDKPHIYYDDYLQNLKHIERQTIDPNNKTLDDEFNCVAAINSQFLSELLSILVVLLDNILDRESVVVFLKNSGLDVNRYRNVNKSELAINLVLLIESFNTTINTNVTEVLKTLMKEMSLTDTTNLSSLTFEALGKFKIHPTDKIYNFENILNLITDILMIKFEPLQLFDYVILKTIRLATFALSTSTQLGDELVTTHMFTHELLTVIIDLTYDRCFYMHKQKNTQYYNMLCKLATTGKNEHEIIRYLKKNNLDTSNLDRIMCVNLNHEQRINRYLNKFKPAEKIPLETIRSSIYALQESKGCGLCTYTSYDLECVVISLNENGLITSMISKINNKN